MWVGMPRRSQKKKEERTTPNCWGCGGPKPIPMPSPEETPDSKKCRVRILPPSTPRQKKKRSFQFLPSVHLRSFSKKTHERWGRRMRLRIPTPSPTKKKETEPQEWTSKPGAILFSVAILPRLLRILRSLLRPAVEVAAVAAVAADAIPDEEGGSELVGL